MKSIKGAHINIFSENTSKNDLFDLLLKNRNIDNVSWYLNPDINSLFDPFLFEWMQNSVERIFLSIKNKERIVVFWDYDVDGVSSTAMLVKFLSSLWAEVSYRLPHRVNDWYGLKSYFIDELHNLNVKLLITVDCWTKDIEAINSCNWYWIDVIITDHHNVPYEIPKWIIALINPKNKWCNYPNKDLSWSWVTFKLIHALAIKLYWENKALEIIKEYIDFAMLWTISDCMPLMWENRIIAKIWLTQLRNSKSHWLKEISNWNWSLHIHNSDIVSFNIWPKLNAAWRMDTPYKALKLLLCWKNLAESCVNVLDDLNSNRKIQTSKYYIEAKNSIKTNSDVIFYISEKIEHWLIWIIAGKLSEEYNKVVVVFKDDQITLNWSIRWPEWIKIVDALDSNKDLLMLYWWHNSAAWLTINKQNLDSFLHWFENNISSQIRKIDITKKLNIDFELNLNEINSKLIKTIDDMHPFWLWNEKPLFITKNIRFDAINFIWKDNNHIKLLMKWIDFDFVAFWFWAFYREIKWAKSVDIIYELENKIWNWKSKINLNIKDFVLNM